MTTVSTTSLSRVEREAAALRPAQRRLPGAAWRRGGRLRRRLVVWFLVAIIIQARRPSPPSASPGSSRRRGTRPTASTGCSPSSSGPSRRRPSPWCWPCPSASGTALALAYLVPHRLRPGLSTAVELLAAVPSVVYGLWGLIVLAPLFREHRRALPDLGVRLDRAVQRTQPGGGAAAGRGDPLHHDPAHHGGHLPGRAGRGAQRAGRGGHGPRRHPVAGAPQGGGARGPHRHPRGVHPGHRAGAGGDGGRGPGHRQLALHRPLAQVAGRHPPVADRQQLRRVDRHRAQRPVRCRPGPAGHRDRWSTPRPGCWCWSAGHGSGSEPWPRRSVAVA